MSMTHEILALLAAIVGTICLIAWPLFRGRQAMLWCQFGIAAGFTLHYALTGIQTAALLNGLGGIQLLASLNGGQQKGLRWIAWAMVPAIGLACVLTWSGLPSVLSTTGMMLMTVGRIQSDPVRLRLLVVAGIPWWLAHDLIVGSPLFIADAISGGVGLWAILRHHQQSHHRPAEQKLPALPRNVVSLRARPRPEDPAAQA